jgi:hypothetical protein
VPQAWVTHAYIDLAGGLVQSGRSADGQSMLLPTTADGIPALVRRVAHDPVVAGPGAVVTVWNGSGISGSGVVDCLRMWNWIRAGASTSVAGPCAVV